MQIQNNSLLKYSSIILSFFIFFVPISLIAGPALPDIFVTLSALYFLIISFFLKLGKYYQNNFFKIFIIFWFFIVINSLFSDRLYISLINSLTYLRFGIFVIVVIFAINTNPNFFISFFYVFVPVFLILIFDTFFQKYFGYNIAGYYTCGNNACARVSSFFRDEWILGGYIFHFFSLFIVLVLLSKFIKSKLNNLLILLFFLIALFAVYFTGERAAFVAMSIFFLFFIFTKINYKVPGKILNNNKKIIILLLILSLVFFNLLRTNNRFNSMSFGSPLAPNSFTLVEVYKDLYATAFKMFLDRPFNGHGNKMFRYKCNELEYKTGQFGCNTHPHNYYFQLLAENGIIGFVFLIFFLYCLIKFSFKYFFLFCNQRDNNAFCLFIISCNLFLCFLPFLPSGNFYTSVTGIFLFMKIGILYGMKYYKKTI